MYDISFVDLLQLTTITCVTAVKLSSPDIRVLRNTPLVQKVRSVLGETLRLQHQLDLSEQVKQNTENIRLHYNF